MKISIITATYNCAATLRQTIQSVINQSYDDIEYIIIDGGSTDGTVDIIKEYEQYISYWVSESDKGIYDAFNKGILKASGDYIEFIGSDDFFYDNDIIREVAKHLTYDVDVVSTCCYIVNEKSKLQYYYSNMHAIDKQTFPGWMIPHAGMFVKADIIKKYMFDTNFKIAADYDFFLKCYFDDNINFKFIDMPVYYFSDSGASSNISLIKQENNIIQRKYNIINNTTNEAGFIFVFKNYFKCIIEKLGMESQLLYFKGWRKHKCNNKFCRWCNGW